jgi:hypothetical protein
MEPTAYDPAIARGCAWLATAPESSGVHLRVARQATCHPSNIALGLVQSDCIVPLKAHREVKRGYRDIAAFSIIWMTQSVGNNQDAASFTQDASRVKQCRLCECAIRPRSSGHPCKKEG